MFCSVQSMGLSGIESYPVTVEVDCRRGLPRFDIVGLPDTAVKESRERVHSAIGNLGYTFPAGVLVVNLAPADTKKSGPLYDLPILLGILAAGCGVDLPLAGSAFVGEISLDGRLRPVNGVLSMVSEAARQGYSRIYIPYDNAAEGSVVQGIEVYPVRTARELVEALTGGIRELDEAVELLPGLVAGDCGKGLFLQPLLLPFLFDGGKIILHNMLSPSSVRIGMVLVRSAHRGKHAKIRP